MRRPPRALLIGLAIVALAGCTVAPTPSLSSPLTAEPTPSPTPSASGGDPSGTARPSATATPEPPLSLDLPDETDDRVVTVAIEPRVGGDGGEIIVIVSSEADERIDELVLRWPRELNRTLFLRPFEPSEQRIAEGGPPLVQDWTKWVLGPGEEGEPAGTVSLGWGPLMAGATLRIPVDVVRRADGAVAFDLQVLSNNAILSLPNGEPAELRVEVP
jgi:hypothetical protein